MRALLAIEWLKIRRYRTFWIQSVLFLALFLLWNWGAQGGILKFGGGLLNSSYSFPAVWGYVGFWGSLFVLFLCILTITLTCNEFTFKTHRQNVMDGWSRLDFFHSKVALVLAGSVLATFFEMLTGILFGATTGGFDGFGEGWEKVLYLFVLNLNYMGLSLLVALFIKRSGLAIGLFFLYAFILDNLLGAIVNKITGTQVGNFMPLQASDEMLPFPIMKTLGGLMGRSSDFSITTFLLVSIAWIAIYYFVGRRLMLRRDY
jgi:ABC-type transport system involved in multi-copper enzyme maturation permease subunit